LKQNDCDASDFHQQTLTVRVQDEALLLHPEKVAYWPAKKTLLVADVHTGKEHIFGRAGVAIPGGASEDTLNLLFSLTASCKAERLLILGDFVHGYHTKNESWVAHLSCLLNKHSELSVEVIAGNHDKPASRELLTNLVVWTLQSRHEPPFVFTHEPDKDSRDYVIAGHLHPEWQLSTHSKENLRAPVFWFQKHIAVLPAFGMFTGGRVIEKRTYSDRLFMTAQGCIVEV